MGEVVYIEAPLQGIFLAQRIVVQAHLLLELETTVSRPQGQF